MSADPSHCPKCLADFDGGPIPKEMRHNYAPPYRWNRVLGISDGSSIVAWQCPDCGHEWPRQVTLRGIRRYRREELN